MLAKQITYVNFNGEEITETFYFNITKAEIIEMEVSHPGGYVDYLERIMNAKERSELIDAFTKLILSAYGEKSEDGRKFRKSKEISEDFHTSEAYSELLVELMSDEDKASEFVRAILPKLELSEEQEQNLDQKMKDRINSMKTHQS